MRELKFRAWVYYGEKLEKPHYSRDYGSLDRFFEDHSENDFGQCIEQYTGLKDKNGKEIYEGDVVKVEDDEYTPDTNKFLGYNATVKASISKGGAFTVKNWWGEQILNWDVPLRRVEVIGNIHENPELLEGK